MNFPGYLKKYFWEVDFKQLSLAKFRRYSLERLMEYGDEKAVRWLRNHFSSDEIKEVLIRVRGLSPRSANFWRLVVRLEPQKVLCLRKSSIAIRKKFWIG
jgi:hypothetical protein